MNDASVTSHVPRPVDERTGVQLPPQVSPLKSDIAVTAAMLKQLRNIADGSGILYKLQPHGRTVYGVGQCQGVSYITADRLFEARLIDWKRTPTSTCPGKVEAVLTEAGSAAIAAKWRMRTIRGRIWITNGATREGYYPDEAAAQAACDKRNEDDAAARRATVCR